MCIQLQSIKNVKILCKHPITVSSNEIYGIVYTLVVSWGLRRLGDMLMAAIGFAQRGGH